MASTAVAAVTNAMPDRSDDGPGTLRETSEPVAHPGVRVVMDVRPIQEPDRAPLTAAYLDGLLGAYDAEPLVRRVLRVPAAQRPRRPDGRRIRHLDVVGRRLLPPTRLLRSAALTIDPFLLRGASLGAAWRADRGGAAGAVYHTAGAGPLPIASGLPIVATLLDLAPWELPDAFARSATARFGQRLRAQLLREAAAVIVVSPSVAKAARRVLHIRADRLRVVPLAPRPAFALVAATRRSAARRRRRERARAPRAAGALPRLLRPLRRPAGPRRRCFGRSSPLAAGRPSGRTPRRRRRGRRGSCSSAPARTIAPPSPVPRPGTTSAIEPQLRASSSRRPWSPGWSAAPGPPSCRPSRMRRASPPSRRSPAGRRSWRRPSAPCPISSGAPGSSSSRAIRTARRRPAGRLGGRPRPRADRGQRPGAGHVAAPDVGRRGARDPGHLRRGRDRPDGVTADVAVAAPVVAALSPPASPRPTARRWPAAHRSRP